MLRACSKCRVKKPLEEFKFQHGCKDNRRPECLECTRAYQRAHGMKNSDSRKARCAKWRSANPARQKAHERAYYERNKAAVVARAAAWAARNPEKALAHTAAMQSRRRAAIAGSPMKKEAHARIVLLRTSPCDCHWCDKHMHGAEHVDHVVPLAANGPHVPENLVPSCADCNLRKSAKVDWPKAA